MYSFASLFTYIFIYSNRLTSTYRKEKNYIQCNSPQENWNFNRIYKKNKLI